MAPSFQRGSTEGSTANPLPNSGNGVFVCAAVRYTGNLTFFDCTAMDALHTDRATIRNRISSLREAMRGAGIDGVIVPSSDPHLSEYLPGFWMARQWLSGFTGSVGTLVVTADLAGLWVDSRYWVQAENELAGTGIQMMRIESASSASHVDWVTEQLKPRSTVAVDGSVLGLAAARQLQAALQAKGITLRTDLDLLAKVWSDRPALPQPPVFEHAAKYVSETRSEKVARVRQVMQAQGASTHFISTLDDIAWLLNLRGSDVEYNPVFVAHLLLGSSSATLFVGEGKVSEPIRQALLADHIEVKPYGLAIPSLKALASGTTLLLDPKRVTLGLREAVPSSVVVIEAMNPSTMMKSRKNSAEAGNVRRAMEEDGAALAEFFASLEAAFERGDALTELTIDEWITARRAERPGFVSPSFATIAGFNANGAMPHYRATEESHSPIAGDGLLLIDSGGQYEFGTTDITRVVPVGNPSAEQRRDYTAVLKGMIALSRLRFPRGTRSPLMDTVARAPIWAVGADYGHGTGHGVGYFLNVHEGPQSISPYAPMDPHTAMEPGMITSNEPGLYRAGKWGIRIENLVLNVSDGQTEFGEFLRFETLTLCPIDTRLIDLSMMTEEEKGWLNGYHAEVRERLLPKLSDAGRAWLTVRTAPI